MKTRDNAVVPPSTVAVVNSAQVVARMLDAHVPTMPTPRELTAIETLLQFATTKRDV